MKSTVREDLEVIYNIIDRVEENRYTCPITHEIMQDPARDKYGHYYEFSAITSWLTTKSKTSPMTRKKLSLNEVHLNRERKEEVDSFMLFMNHDSRLKEEILVGIFQSIQRAVSILHDQQPLELISELFEKKVFEKNAIVSYFLKDATNKGITVKQIVETHSIVNTLHNPAKEYEVFNKFLCVWVRSIFDYCLNKAEKRGDKSILATDLFGLYSSKKKLGTKTDFQKNPDERSKINIVF